MRNLFKDVGEFQEKTAQRLSGYRVFSRKTISTVAKAAAEQSKFSTYKEFFKAVGVGDVQTHFDKKGRGVSYVDIPAAKKERGVIVFHLPMANPLDTNQLYQVATIAWVMRNYRVIAFGNPAGEPFSYEWQNLRAIDRARIATTGNRKALVSAEIDYLDSQNITSYSQVGFSYGAAKALIQSQYLPRDSVKNIVSIEPVSHPRGPLELLHDFTRTGEPLGDYVHRTGLKTFIKAREDAGGVDYYNGLLRPINLAIGLMLSRFDLMKTLQKVRYRHDKARITVVWGSKSELADDTRLIEQLGTRRPRFWTRLRNDLLLTMRLKGDRHALANDVHLTSAIVLESLR